MFATLERKHQRKLTVNLMRGKENSSMQDLNKNNQCNKNLSEKKEC